MERFYDQNIGEYKQTDDGRNRPDSDIDRIISGDRFDKTISRKEFDYLRPIDPDKIKSVGEKEIFSSLKIPINTPGLGRKLITLKARDELAERDAETVADIHEAFSSTTPPIKIDPASLSLLSLGYKTEPKVAYWGVAKPKSPTTIIQPGGVMGAYLPDQLDWLNPGVTIAANSRAFVYEVDNHNPQVDRALTDIMDYLSQRPAGPEDVQ